MQLLTTLFSYDYAYTTTTTTSSGTSSVPPGLIFGLIGVYFIVILILLIIPLWKIYGKAGKPGWAAIVPIYNSWVLFEIVGYPGWWAILGIIPIVNLFPAIMLLVSYFKLAKLFGKGTGFAVCTVLFPFVCLPILGYGKAQYQGNDDDSEPLSNGLPPTTPQQYAQPSQPTNPVFTSPTPQQPAVQPGVPQQPGVPPTQPPTPPQNPPVVQG